MGHTLIFLITVVLINLTTSHNSYIPRNRRAVGSCTPPEITDLGRVDTFSATGLVSKSFIYLGFPEPEVQILDFHVVCESAGLVKGTVSSFSAMVMFRCRGSGCNNSVLIQQIQADCNLPINNHSSNFEYPRIFSRGYIRTVNPIGNFSTSIDKHCGQCLDPSGSRRQVNLLTHCAGMSKLLFFKACMHDLIWFP